MADAAEQDRRTSHLTHNK